MAGPTSPPLRERREDIPWLADRFLELKFRDSRYFESRNLSLEEFNEAHPEASGGWGAAVRESLAHYPWPGNVRELKHCIERACVMSRGPVIECDDLFNGLESVMADRRGHDRDLKTYLRSYERVYILEVLERNDWAIGRSAGELGISRKSLWEKMRRLEIGAAP